MMGGQNDDLFLQYMIEMGAMTPDEEKLMRQQKMVDTLRSQAMNAPQGEMVGKHYVAPSIAQYASQIGSAFMAKKGQGKLDAGYDKYNTDMLDKTKFLRDQLAKRRNPQAAVAPIVPVDEDEERRLAMGMGTPFYQ